jgi:hypothetical protein
MNHPPREDWVPYLFGEVETESRRQLRAHLQSCPECRGQIERWKHTLGRLDVWQLPKRARPREGFAPVFRWAVATALVMLGLGFALGRLATPAPNPAQLQAAIEQKLRQELRGDLARMLHEELAASDAALAGAGEQTKTWLAEYASAFDARLNTERAERVADCLSLKQDVDTLAINADASLRHTQQGLALLAHYPPGTAPEEPGAPN